MMFDCMEAVNYDNRGKTWECESDSSKMHKNFDELVFLNGYSGSFCCRFLVEVGTIKVFYNEGEEIKLYDLIKEYSEVRVRKMGELHRYSTLLGLEMHLDEWKGDSMEELEKNTKVKSHYLSKLGNYFDYRVVKYDKGYVR
ncbi:hypothetical protein [Tenacibaculum finnmarkense]|uniref:hypothetical protein n=1 Tax=Tenacibaculum finnmarkense TaxID=2781243 RepID=UPI00187BA33C|nr:hypothetical protein [Tenacibaculum finnmarkense]